MNKKARRRLGRELLARHETQQAQVITSLIPREDVEAMNVSRTLAAIQFAAMSAQTARRFRDRVYLGIGGYAEADGELHQHGSVRRYLRELDRQFPYLFWFSNASTDPEGGNTFLLLLLRSTCAATEIPGRGDFIGNGEVIAFVRRHTEAMSELGARLGLAPAETESRRREVLNFYRTYVPGLDRALSPAS